MFYEKEIKIYPTNFKLALDSRGMSLTELAKKSEIPYAKLKRYASDLEQRYSSLFQPDGHDISKEELEVIASWLQYPIRFFYDRPIEIYEPIYYCTR